MSSIYYVVNIKIMGYWVQQIMSRNMITYIIIFISVSSDQVYTHKLYERGSECECVRGTLYVGIGEPMPTHSRGRCQLSNVYLCFIALRPGLSLNLRLLAMLSDCRALDVLCLLPSNARFTSMCTCVHFYVSSGEFNSGLIFAQEIILPTKPSLQPKL